MYKPRAFVCTDVIQLLWHTPRRDTGLTAVRTFVSSTVSPMLSFHISTQHTKVASGHLEAKLFEADFGPFSSCDHTSMIPLARN